MRQESAQKIYAAVLEFDPTVYGISIALNSLGDGEIFNERHIHKGIQNLIPGIKWAPGSYFCRREGEGVLFYLEIKKIRGGVFSKIEKKRLVKELHSELARGIERISRSIYLPGNEEELFKNIRHLCREIKYVGDLPQVMITFVEYSQETLKFLVIAARVIKPATPSILSLSLRLPSGVQFSVENVLYAENLRKKYPKEAAVFTLEVDSSSS